jgi:hypothetical protein
MLQFPKPAQRKPEALPSGFNPARLTEKQVSEQLDDMMRAEGWRRIRHSSGTATRVDKSSLAVGMMNIGEPGMPDRQYIYYLGKASGFCLVVWVELKRSKGGKLRESQVNWHAREKSRGALIYPLPANGTFSIDDFRAWYDKNLRPKIARVAKGQKGLFDGV